MSRFSRYRAGGSRQFKTAAWALRIGFVIALLFGVWLARPQAPTATPPGSVEPPPQRIDQSSKPSTPAPEHEAIVESETADSHSDSEPAESDERQPEPRTGDSFPANSNPEPTAASPNPPLDTEIRATLERIAAGGPYPFRQDDTVFLNREERLPKKPLGYYREYTVKTPGAGDRGPRRIVRGEGGELYFTEDHYRSFLSLDDADRSDERATFGDRERDSRGSLPRRAEPGARSR